VAGQLLLQPHHAQGTQGFHRYYRQYMLRCPDAVHIRYLPDDMSTAYILCDGKKFPIRRTDRNGNCRTKRRNLPAIDYAKAVGEA
jgi:hypothetical protein